MWHASVNQETQLSYFKIALESVALRTTGSPKGNVKMKLGEIGFEHVN